MKIINFLYTATKLSQCKLTGFTFFYFAKPWILTIIFEIQRHFRIWTPLKPSGNRNGMRMMMVKWKKMIAKWLDRDNQQVAPPNAANSFLILLAIETKAEYSYSCFCEKQ